MVEKSLWDLPMFSLEAQLSLREKSLRKNRIRSLMTKATTHRLRDRHTEIGPQILIMHGPEGISKVTMMVIIRVSDIVFGDDF
jgi:hypothetical protein